MKGWIELNVLYNTDESRKFNDLELRDLADEYLVYQREAFQISTISSIRLENTIDKDEDTQICVNGRSIYVKESSEKIFELIINN